MRCPNSEVFQAFQAGGQESEVDDKRVYHKRSEEVESEAQEREAE